MENTNYSYVKTLIWVLLLSLFGISISAWIGQTLTEMDLVNGQMRHLLQGIFHTGIVLAGILLIRKYVDKNPSVDFGLVGQRKTMIHFVKGISMVVVPLIVTLCLALLFGWTNITINFDFPIFQAVLIGFITVILFEAVPEELLFRGYVYGLFKTKKSIWVSAIATTLLFTSFPLLLYPVQKFIFGLETSFGPSGEIEAGYLIILLIFGSFMAFLRVISGSIWIGVGFHCMFVFINRLIGFTDTSVIQIMGEGNQGAIQMTMMVCYVLMIALVVRQYYINNKKSKVVFVAAN